MQKLLRLDPPLPVVTPKGKGFAHVLIDYGIEHHLVWVVFLDSSGECWSFQNSEIRIQNNPTIGRPVSISEALKNGPGT